ncbi:hypothetical protein TEA_021317 [Camellia sinensis var. sinensis]|uniref:Serine/threonine-protein phosphatase 2A 55 kDa regulatory subunit B n=1 Tax=Camellia sinensis var. sinensis TaxID=542762 RepID=A0A4S4F247_CAMSN|nr:hypothetical protein TEA_021317 [Camellia sinensis var. sinensis]
MNGGDDGEVAAAPPPALEWKFSQVFGERTAGEEVQEVELAKNVMSALQSFNLSCLADLYWVQPYSWLHKPVWNLKVALTVCRLHVDIISAIEFDKTGDHLATGDRGGRVVLFERTDTKDHGGSRRDLERMDYAISRHPEFRYKTEFQSHEPEFDYLKSLEIEEKINKIRWCQTANGALFLLSTNDKTIKFWKVQEKKVKKISDMNIDPSKAVGNGGIASSSVSSSPRSYLANGGYTDRSCNNLSNDFSFPPGGIPSLRLPVVTSHETSLVARCRRVYAHAHDYHINSISNNRCDQRRTRERDRDEREAQREKRCEGSNRSIDRSRLRSRGREKARERESSGGVRLSDRLTELRSSTGSTGWSFDWMELRLDHSTSDGETFISADDLRINLWNLEISNQSFNIVDVKPANMEDLTEVITSAEFHPTHCNMLAYSSSKGSIRLIDLRQSALCDTHSKLFEEQEAPGSRSFFTEIIASISDIKFGKDGRYILSRDYMTLKVGRWAGSGAMLRIGTCIWIPVVATAHSTWFPGAWAWHWLGWQRGNVAHWHMCTGTGPCYWHCCSWPWAYLVAWHMGLVLGTCAATGTVAHGLGPTWLLFEALP